MNNQIALIDKYKKAEVDELRQNLSAGTVVRPTLTDNLAVDGTITIGTGTYRLYTSSDGISNINLYTIAGNTFIINEFTIYYIVANYNSETPLIQCITDRSLINETTIIPIFTLVQTNNSLSKLGWNTEGKVLSNKLHQQQVYTRRFKKEYNAVNELVVTDRGNLYLNISQGYIWYGTARANLSTMNSEDDLVKQLYHIAGNWVAVDNIKPLDNIYYDNGTDLVELSNNRYAVRWIWRDVDESNKRICITYGRGDYKLVDAQLETLPEYPSTLGAMGVCIAKVIIKKGATTITEIQPVIDGINVIQNPVKHNETLEIQGGDLALDEYYHSKYEDYLKLVNNTLKVKHGIDDANQLNSSYNPVTQTLTINPLATSWSYYNQGVKYDILTELTITHANVSGGYFVYFNSSNVLTVSTSFWNLLVDIPLYYIIYNGTTGFALIELHGKDRNLFWHIAEHFNRGTWVFNGGFGYGGITLSTDTDASKKLTLEAGIIKDEDLYNSILAFDINIKNIRNFYINGAYWTWQDTSLPLLSSATYIYYNGETIGNYSLTPAVANRYINYYIVAMKTLNSLDIGTIMGQNAYSSVDDANNETFADLNFTGQPFQEIAFLYKITYKTQANYTSTGKCVIISITRITGSIQNINSISYNQQSHNLLSNLAYENAGHTGFGRLAYSATSDPLVTNDGVDTAGIGRIFRISDTWLNTSSYEYWLSVNSSTGTALWKSFLFNNDDKNIITSGYLQGSNISKYGTENYQVFGSTNITGTYNLSIGSGALNGASNNYCIAIGYYAGYANQGDYLAVFGYYAGYFNIGDYLTAYGSEAGRSNSGYACLLFGSNSGQNNTGDYLVAFGNIAGRNNTGNNCLFLGYTAGDGNTLNDQFILRNLNNILMTGDFSTQAVNIPGILQTGGYKSSDGTAGITESITCLSSDYTSVRTLNVKNGLYTGYSDAPATIPLTSILNIKTRYKAFIGEYYIATENEYGFLTNYKKYNNDIDLNLKFELILTYDENQLLVSKIIKDYELELQIEAIISDGIVTGETISVI